MFIFIVLAFSKSFIYKLNQNGNLKTRTISKTNVYYKKGKIEQ